MCAWKCDSPLCPGINKINKAPCYPICEPPKCTYKCDDVTNIVC